MSQSLVLLGEIDRTLGLPFALPSAFLQDPSRQGDLTRTLTLAQDQHRALIEAIAKREGARAEAPAREHIRAARQNLVAQGGWAATRSGACSLL